MHGLVSLLPQPYYKEVEDIWNELETEHGLTGIKVTPYPHFSWQIAEDYDLDDLKNILHELTENTAPFEIHTSGIGIFTGHKPVIYIPVVKSVPLMKLHARIWQMTKDTGRHISNLYSPETWMPHISLAYEDVDEANIAAVMENLFFRSFSWAMTIDNIAFIYEPNGEIGQLKFQFEFKQPPATNDENASA